MGEVNNYSTLIQNLLILINIKRTYVTRGRSGGLVEPTKVKPYDGVTGLHGFTYGVLKMHSLIYDCACVLKFSSNEYVFERLCFFIRHDWWLREDNVEIWLVLD